MCANPLGSNRFKFDGDGYYLKSAAEGVPDLGRRIAEGACDSTLVDRRTGAVPTPTMLDTARPDAHVPVPDGHDQRHNCVTGGRRASPAISGRSPDGYRNAPPTNRHHMSFPSYSDRRRRYARSANKVNRPQLAAGWSYALGITDRPDSRGLFRALSAPRCDIIYRLRDRRRGGAHAADEVGPTSTRSRRSHHLRHHQNQSGAEGFGAKSLQPGFAIADRITKALPPAIMAKTHPRCLGSRSQYKEAAAA